MANTPEYMADYYQTNREAILAKEKERRSDPAYKAKKAFHMRAWRNGLTTDELRTFLAEHNYQCDVCGAPEQVIDHDHSCCAAQTPNIPHKDRPKRLCGKCIRGLLCHSCNGAIGQMQDDPVRLRKAADYLDSK